MFLLLCQCRAALLIDFLCFVKLSFGHLSGVIEVVNPGNFVVVRHAIGFSSLRLLSNHAFTCCLRRLLLFGDDFVSLITLKVCFQLSFRGGRDKIVREKWCLGTRLFLESNLGRLLEVFLIFCAFFVYDHGLITVVIGADHVYLEDFWRFVLSRRFNRASFTELTHFFVRDHRMIIHVHRLLITRRNFTMLYLFEVLALVVGQSQGLFVADLHFRGVITWVRKVVDHFLHGFELLLPPGHMRVHVLNQCARWSSFHLLHS